MAKSYRGLQQQVEKIKGATEKIAPPQPNDEFESLRAEVLKSIDKLEVFLNGIVTGDGSMSIPAAEPE